MENNVEETFEQRGITEKEINLHDYQLMALLLDLPTKANTSILSRERWVHTRMLPSKEHIDACTPITLSERKRLVSRKRDATEADLGAGVLLDPITETTNDVRARVSVSMFDFGVEVEASVDDTDVDMDDEDFLNETRLKGGVEVDNAIKIWIRCVPNWKGLSPKI